MDYYSILDNNSSQAAPETAPASFVPATMDTTKPTTEANLVPRAAHEALRFPGEDGGKSLSEMAQRDLDATLQLLAERAQYITGASGAAIALREGESMVCCASVGDSAPELGAHLQIDSGLSAESVRTRQILRCDDAENDPRVNRESCRAFGIASVVVMPLVRGEEVFGVFELLSGQPHAFEERDFIALNRLAEMIQTAVEHAEAARRAEKELGDPPRAAAAAASAGPGAAGSVAQPFAKILEADPETWELETSDEPTSPAEPVAALEPNSVLAAEPALDEVSELAPDFEEQPSEIDLSTPISTIAYGNLRRCQSCGFPVSEGRRLCLDCEAATPDASPDIDAPEFFAELGNSDKSWVQSHLYLIATALIVAATIAVLVWRF